MKRTKICACSAVLSKLGSLLNNRHADMQAFDAHEA